MSESSLHKELLEQLRMILKEGRKPMRKKKANPDEEASQ